MRFELSSSYVTPPKSNLALSFMSSAIYWLLAVAISRRGIDRFELVFLFLTLVEAWTPYSKGNKTKKAFIGNPMEQRNGRSLLYMHDLGLSLQRVAPRYSIAVALCYTHKPRPLANSVREVKTTGTYNKARVKVLRGKESRIPNFCCASSEDLLFRCFQIIIIFQDIINGAEF